jgi:hypothetical protein
VRLGTGRGRRGELVGVLTDGGDAGTQLESKEDGGDQPWWSARSPCNGADSVDLRRWETTPWTRLVDAKLLVGSVHSGCAPKRESGGGDRLGWRTGDGAEARHGWRRKKQGARAGLDLSFKGSGGHSLAWRGSQGQRWQPCCGGHDLCGLSGSAGPRWASAGLLAGPTEMRVGPSGSTRLDRIGYGFFIFLK